MRRQLLVLGSPVCSAALWRPVKRRPVTSGVCTPRVLAGPGLEPCPRQPRSANPPPPKPHCGLFKHLDGCGHLRLSGLCHKKPACAGSLCRAVMEVAYPAPSPQASPQAYASGQ